MSSDLRFVPFGISRCRVNAGGVPAEWVEATLATPDQRTVVLFFDGCGDALDDAHPAAADLAWRSGARVLVVACRGEGDDPWSAMAERAVTAYGWLLEEGCNPETTAFTSEPPGNGLLSSIVGLASDRHLPVPPTREAAGRWPLRPAGLKGAVSAAP